VLEREARLPDRTWTYGADPDQVADVYDARGRRSTSSVVLVHGGFWRPDFDRVHARHLAAHLADLGHLVISLDYRRRPGAPDDTVADIREALSELTRQTWLPPRALQAVGHSAGGHLVLLVAADPGTPLSSALALAPVADLEVAEAQGLDGDAVTAFLGKRAEERPDLDPARRDPPRIPVTIVHGEHDTIVPRTVTTQYLEHLPGDGRPRLITLPRVGHFEVIDPDSPAMTDVVAALDELAAS